MAKKEKLISGFENLFSSPNLQSVLGQLGNSGGYTPTADALSVPFGVTFEQGQQLVKNAIDRDTTAAAIESEKMRTKAEQERIKVAREGLDLERQREAKNDLTESQKIERETAARRSEIEASGQQQRQTAELTSRLDTESDIAAEKRAIENIPKQFEATQNAISEFIAQNPNSPYAQELQLGLAEQRARINQINASASASRASAAAAGRSAEVDSLRLQREKIQLEMSELDLQHALTKAQGGPEDDPEYITRLLELADKGVDTYKVLNPETQEMETPDELRQSNRERVLATRYAKGEIGINSLVGVFDPGELDKLVDLNNQLRAAKTSEEVTAIKGKIATEAQAVIDSRVAETQAAINAAAVNANGGVAGAAIGSKPGTTPTGRQPLPGEGMPNNGYPHPIVTEVIDPAIEELLPLAQSFADTIGMGVDEMLNALGVGTEPSKSIINRIKGDNANRRASSSWPVENMDISGTAKKVLGR